MLRKNVLVKVSGDLFMHVEFIDWVATLCVDSWVVICVGAGKQINERFSALGLPVREHGPLGRELQTMEERVAHREVMELNQQLLQDALSEKRVAATVDIPFITFGTVQCPVNGDVMVRATYLGYDELYVVTTPDRLTAKKLQFADLKKVSIVAFESL